MEATFRLAARRGGRAIRETRLAPAPASPSRVTSSHFRQSATGRREHRAERMDSRQKEAEGKGEFPPLAMRRTARREESFRRRLGKRSRSDGPQITAQVLLRILLQVLPQVHCGFLCRSHCKSRRKSFRKPRRKSCCGSFANSAADLAPPGSARTGRALARPTRTPNVSRETFVRR